ncbi:MAG TPA: hypothetical protein VI072_17515 [Polyangiaceae bacterium]
MITLRHGGALLALAAFSCASRQAPTLVGQPIKKPVAVLVRVSDEVAQTDDFGGTASLVETIERGLAERGVESEIFAADDDNPPAPRIEIWVERWDAGDRGERAAMRLGTTTATAVASHIAGGGIIATVSTAGAYIVHCRIYREGETQPAYVHRYSGRIVGTEAEASADEGEDVGESIVADAFRKPRAKRTK